MKIPKARALDIDYSSPEDDSPKSIDPTHYESSLMQSEPRKKQATVQDNSTFSGATAAMNRYKLTQTKLEEVKSIANQKGLKRNLHPRQVLY